MKQLQRRVLLAYLVLGLAPVCAADEHPSLQKLGLRGNVRSVFLLTLSGGRMLRAESLAVQSHFLRTMSTVSLRAVTDGDTTGDSHGDARCATGCHLVSLVFFLRKSDTVTPGNEG